MSVELIDNCCCAYVDGEHRPSVEETIIRRAAKFHYCGECRAVIVVGEKYECHSGVYDGKWSHHKTCLPCVGIRNDFFKCGWFFGQMREDFRECHGFDYCEAEKEGDDRGVPEDDHQTGM